MERQETEARLRNIICEELKLDGSDLRLDTNLRESRGVESVQLFHIFARIENDFDIEMEDEVIFALATFDEFCSAVQELVEQAGS